MAGVEVGEVEGDEEGGGGVRVAVWPRYMTGAHTSNQTSEFYEIQLNSLFG